MNNPEKQRTTKDRRKRKNAYLKASSELASKVLGCPEELLQHQGIEDLSSGAIGKGSVQGRPEVIVVREGAVDGADLVLSSRIGPQGRLLGRILRSLPLPPFPFQVSSRVLLNTLLPLHGEGSASRVPRRPPFHFHSSRRRNRRRGSNGSRSRNSLTRRRSTRSGRRRLNMGKDRTRARAGRLCHILQ
ncbi:hypothetical protein PIB30_066965 [Stylosanthes scabra]|uniref:Uncharacterized protein n=1 Tax=Stylosanthes scabra TaxID=79078 RepID=A0ABU6VKW5_9FABA|nr:hypothetical protein [Stylosanthes scabra]